MIPQKSAASAEALLDDAEAFARAGSYSEALARARCVEIHRDKASSIGARAARAVATYRALARAENEADHARGAAHVARERTAISGVAGDSTSLASG